MRDADLEAMVEKIGLSPSELRRAAAVFDHAALRAERRQKRVTRMERRSVRQKLFSQLRASIAREAVKP